MKLIIVESPTKAKTIRKFLGKDYVVESCMGHVRDLPQSSKDIPDKLKKEKWAQLGVNVDSNFEPLYIIPKDKLKVIKNLKDKLQDANELYLATDEDREGESISWHLVEVLKPKIPTKRMVFHEITKEAIQKSLKETREIDLNLVQAQEARRVLDRLVGYTISPLLWKKVAYGLSAGRVQSVAVRLIVEREFERLKFKKSAYWGLLAELEKNNIKFESRLTQWQKMRVATGKDFDGDTGLLIHPKDTFLLDEKKAKDILSYLQTQKFAVHDVEEKPVQRRPAAPFITSTLQQEANRKLGLSSRETMQVAQKLYEQGYITYMRTDSTFLSEEAMKAARNCIQSKYGADYLPSAPRNYAAKKVKGAQEAHEAIRPAGAQFVDPDQTDLSGTQLKLYELIWKRTVASQMVDARQKQVSVKIHAGEAIFSSSGMTIEFPGFLRAYVEGSDDPEAELQEREVRLPILRSSEELKRNSLEPTSHETKPPARYTEASLVQTMEKEGIGRPSTYASVIGTIIDRGYVRKNGTQLVPTFTALVVSKLLKNYLTKYVDLNFTSMMEKSLDMIAEGDLNSEKYLKTVYLGKDGLRALVESQAEVIEPEEARSIKLDGLEDFVFHVGKFGAYLTTKKNGEQFSASIPDSETPAEMTADTAMKLIEQKINGADSLGTHKATGKAIYVLNGRYGPYVQLGESDEEVVKRVSLPQGVTPESVTLQMAEDLLSLPKTLGLHPETQTEVKVGLGRFGPYIHYNGEYRSIPKTDSLFTIPLSRALEILAQPKKGRGSRSAALQDYGPHPLYKESVQLMNGPYGLYLKCGKANVSLPEGEDEKSLNAAKAFDLVHARIDSDSKLKKKMGMMAGGVKASGAAKKKATKSASAKAPAVKVSKPKTSAPVENAVTVKKTIIKRSGGSKSNTAR